MPYACRCRMRRDDWKTVIEDMGMPAGKPKTIAVDLQFPLRQPQASHCHQPLRLLG